MKWDSVGALLLSDAVESEKSNGFFQFLSVFYVIVAVCCWVDA